VDEGTFQEAQPLLADLNTARIALKELQVMREEFITMRAVMTPARRFDYRVGQRLTTHHVSMNHTGVPIVLDMEVFQALGNALRREEERLSDDLRELGMEVRNPV
jgi:hypothetical protein